MFLSNKCNISSFYASTNYNINHYNMQLYLLFSALDIGFKYLAMDKKLTLSLMAYDIFKIDLTTLSTNVQNIPQSFKQYYDSQSIRFSVSYKFGNSKINVSKGQTSNAEEANRS
ncbi:outer membrane beta-barrel protein [Empedobacter brevis]|uniref:outer membrane beta-barrel protein n=1 Tax=Empedobacter brevis TaxID=247 RepID=UPI0039AEFC98